MKILSKILYYFFLPFKGILGPFEWLGKKCTYLGHSWETYSSVKKKRVIVGLAHNFKREFTDILHYRECKYCDLKQTRYVIMGKQWKTISKCPKEIKKYLNQKGLNKEEKKELEEYMENMYDL